MSVTIQQYFNIIKNPKGSIGVEIEVEGHNLPPDELVSEHWNATHDGSLRGESREYVLPSPRPLAGVKTALDFMQKTFAKSGSTINNSVRAGVHVHLNVNSLTINQLFTFAASYYILEELLTRWCGPGRQGNQFALRLMDAYDVVGHIRAFLESGRHSILSTDDIRYAACNYCAVRKYGSLEFRQLGTSPDLSRVYRWAEVLHTIMQRSIESYQTPQQVVTSFSGYGYDDFVRSLLPPDMADEFIFCHTDYASSMRDSARLVQDWAFFCPSDDVWSKRYAAMSKSTRKETLQSVEPAFGRFSLDEAVRRAEARAAVARNVDFTTTTLTIVDEEGPETNA